MSKDIYQYRVELAEISLKLTRDNELDLQHIQKIKEDLFQKQIYHLYGYATYLLGSYYMKRADYESYLVLIDDLKSIANEEKGFTLAYFYVMDAIYHWYYGQKWDICIENFDKALSLLNKLEKKDHLLHYTIIYMKGATYSAKRDLKNAYKYLLESVSIELDDIDLYNKGKAYQWLGITEGNQGNPEKAIENYKKGAEIFKKYSMRGAYSDLLNSIGMLYINFNKTDHAIECFKESLSIAKKYNLVDTLADAYNNLGITYEKINQFQKAEKNYFHSLEVRQKTNNMKRISETFIGLGNLYTEMKAFEKAYEYLFKGLDLVKKHQSKNIGLIVNINCSIANFFLKKNDLKNALKYGKKAEILSSQSDDKTARIKVYDFMLRYFTEKKQYKDALKYTNLYYSLKVEANHEQANTNLEMLHLEIEAEKLKHQFDKELESEKIKAVLAMAVTANHEINQPLTVIQLSAGLIKLDKNFDFLSERQIKHLDKIEEEIGKIFNILSKYKNSESFLIDNYICEKTKLVVFDENG